MVSQRDRNQWITPVFPEKPKPADSTLGPGKGILPFRVGFDRRVNRTFGSQRPFLLSSYSGSTLYNTGFAIRFSSRTVKIHFFQTCHRPIPFRAVKAPSLQTCQRSIPFRPVTEDGPDPPSSDKVLSPNSLFCLPSFF